jgi:hypothetical protein
VRGSFALAALDRRASRSRFSPTMSNDRIDLAEELLREAVYRSRAMQGVATMLAKRSADEGNCGLGAKAAVVLDLSPRGQELFERMFQHGDELQHGEGSTVTRVQSCLREWIVAQDAIDRRRNHFLKAFRNEHGNDRTKYSASQTAELEAGLARINDDEDRARRSAAESLLRD